MRGRKPKPLTQHAAEGDPSKFGRNKLQEKIDAQPKATRGLPPCPRHLQGRARAAWNFWREELEAMKLDHRPDAMMLEGACVNYARAVQNDLILRHGCQVEEPIVNSEGEQTGVKVKNHPALTAFEAELMAILAGPREKKPNLQ